MRAIRRYWDPCSWLWEEKNHTGQQWEVCRGDRESSEDETQRLFETLDAATVIERIAGATIGGCYNGEGCAGLR